MILIKLVFNMIWHIINFRDLEKRTQSDIALKNKALKIASNPKYNGYGRGLASMVYKFFDKKLKGAGLENQMKFINQLLENFKKEKFILLLRTIFGVLI